MLEEKWGTTMLLTHHIIIADDEVSLRLLIKLAAEQFRRWSASVSAVENGQEALQLYEQVGADLIISNGDMPLLDGPKLARTLRAQGVTVPIIIMANNPDIEIEARQAGATLFLSKTELFIRLPQILARYLPPVPVVAP